MVLKDYILGSCYELEECTSCSEFLVHFIFSDTGLLDCDVRLKDIAVSEV